MTSVLITGGSTKKGFILYISISFILYIFYLYLYTQEFLHTCKATSMHEILGMYDMDINEGYII